MAVDTVYLHAGESTSDFRRAYKIKILEEALQATQEKYGDYDIIINKFYMSGNSGFKHLADGQSINVFFALARRNIDSNIMPIPIPIRRGLVSYRLLMIKRGTEQRFSEVNTLEDLKKLRIGSDSSWATHQTLLHHQFTIVNVPNYESMFTMLNAKAFDYLPRTVNEIFPEIDRFKSSALTLSIEPNLALYIPSATYIHVNKNYPRLEQRLREGLEKMINNGTLVKIFSTYYGQRINKANLSKRKIIRIDNPAMPENADWENLPYWFSPTFNEVKKVKNTAHTSLY